MESGTTVLVHALMCGGSGKRLWPWSRRSFPKQFLPLMGEQSLLQTTADRIAGISAAVETIAVGNEEHRFLIAEHLNAARLGVREIVLEPVGRNTAAVAIVAALRAEALHGPDSVVLLSASDHHIADVDAYCNAIERAIPVARSGKVVTFGVTPNEPHTGYGYIESGEILDPAARIHGIAGFREKPDLEIATNYLKRNNFLWNAGIFLFAPTALLALAAELRPEMLAACRRACNDGVRDLDFFRLAAEPYSEIEDISFDHAFMERIGDSGAVVPVSMGWSDIGSWASIRRTYGATINGTNAAKGSVEMFDCERVLGLSEGPLVVAHGLTDLIVVANYDAVYVASAAASEDSKFIVAELEKRGRREAVTHEKVFRPWGWFETINRGNNFHVKEIMVRPGGRLSLQSHRRRAEHWVVVRGTARVTVDDVVKFVAENESVYIPIGARHRLENLGDAPMHLIEVQTGDYLEEDDIVRFDDQYGRP